MENTENRILRELQDIRELLLQVKAMLVKESVAFISQDEIKWRFSDSYCLISWSDSTCLSFNVNNKVYYRYKDFLALWLALRPYESLKTAILPEYPRRQNSVRSKCYGLLVGLLKTGQPGAVLTYEELTKAVGGNTAPGGSQRSACVRAMRDVAKKFGVIWKHKPGANQIECVYREPEDDSDAG